jgi:hypothetical protein
VLTGTPAAPLVPLAPVKSSLHDITIDLTRELRPHLGVASRTGMRAHHRRLRPDPQAIPRLDLNQALLIGYSYQPHGADVLGTDFHKW